MAEKLEAFTFSRGMGPKPPRFEKFFDGQIWKIHPDEFDLDSAKHLAAALKVEAKKCFGRYVRTAQVLDGSVVVQVQPEDYKPKSFASGRKKATPAPDCTA